MSPFRLFGRAPESRPPADDEPDPRPAWAGGPWDRGPAGGDPRPATRHARPVAFGHAVPGPDGSGPDAFDPDGFDAGGFDPDGFDAGPGRRRDGRQFGRAVVRADADPLTDPHGFPPVPPLPSAGYVAPPPPVPDPLEAAALAGAFAADYLSWDEDDPARRGRALADHLAGSVGDPTRLGWDGRGRQRAELVLPGLVRADGDDRVLVDVRVRVTPYREVDGARERPDGPDAASDRPEPDVLGVPAAAPAPTGRGWRGCASSWVRLSVPVVREDGRLVVDAAEETAEEIAGAPARRPGGSSDPAPVVDPPTEFLSAGSWADSPWADPSSAGSRDDSRDGSRDDGAPDGGSTGGGSRGGSHRDDGYARVHALRPVGGGRTPDARDEHPSRPAAPAPGSAW